MSFYSEHPDWKWHFDHSIDWDKVLDLYYPNNSFDEGIQNKEEAKEFFEDLVMALGDWAKNSIAAKARELDQVGAGVVEDGRTIPSSVLNQIYNEAKELSLFSLIAAKEFNGMGAPVSVYLMGFAHICRGDIAAATQLGFFSSIIDMLERFCPEEHGHRLIPEIIKGDLSGSMNLTEPGSGSDVGSLSTSAEHIKDNLYKINGSKIFITNGGGGIGFVLARVKGSPEGLDGISLFLVEQDTDLNPGKLNYRVVKNEEKMGFHGSFTCEVLYEDSVGILVGEKDQGFQYMLHLMNEARISVGVQTLGGMEACFQYAKNYALDRKQFGKPIYELPLLNRQMKDWETEIDAFRSLIVDTIQYFDIYQFLDMKKRKVGQLSEKEQAQYNEALKWVRLKTPIVKYYGSEFFTLLSQRCIQVLGGYGFMKEYDAEKWHRDSFAPLLYEGTSQIQSLMCVKDIMKNVMKNPRRFFQSVMTAHPLSSFIGGQSEVEREFSKVNYEFKKHLASLIVKTLKPDVQFSNPGDISRLFDAKNWMTDESISKLMMHAETICQAQCYVETLRVLKVHALKDQSRVHLFNDYNRLVQPRLKAIWTDWKVR